MHEEQSLLPVELLVLQGTPLCNLNCGYCDLSIESRKQSHSMPIHTAVRLFEQLQTLDLLADKVSIVWHSGEPLTLPIDYYEDAINALLAKNENHPTAKPRKLSFDFQTNGTLINQDWCDFFKSHEHHLRLGVSCDGPKALHDNARLNWSGRGSHNLTVRGMDLLAANGIPYNAIAVVTDATLDEVDAFYNFFNERSNELTDFHFNILANHQDGGDTIGYTNEDAIRYAEFYRRLISISENNTDHSLIVRNFSQTLGRIIAAGSERPPNFVSLATAPLRQLNCDAYGNITTFYAGLDKGYLPDAFGDGDGLSLGNINGRSLEKMLNEAKLGIMMSAFKDSHDHCMKTCDYYEVCTGGFELTQLSEKQSFSAGETTECLIHVKTLVDELVTNLSRSIDSPVIA